ncbi:hypothetical protein GW17_00023362, partial [Ensete ventricosum]
RFPAQSKTANTRGRREGGRGKGWKEAETWGSWSGAESCPRSSSMPTSMALSETPRYCEIFPSFNSSNYSELAKDLGEKGVIAFADVVHVIMKTKKYTHLHLCNFFSAFSMNYLYVVIEDFAAENVVYLELRTTPKVPNHKEIQAMLDICPQRIGHACFLVEEEWKRVKFLKIPVYYIRFIALIYWVVSSYTGLNKNEMFLLARSAIQSTFADEEVKHELTKIFEDAENRLII